MKKIFASVLALCMLMTFASFPAMAETTNPHRVKIFTIGDSFTEGICEPNAYRYYVYEPLIQAGGVFEFIGPRTSGDWRVTDMYKKHGGVGGAVIGVADDYTWNGSSWVKNAWSVTTDNGITISSAGNLNNIHYRLFAGYDGSNDYTKTEYGNYVAQADIVTLYIGLNDYYSVGATGRSADIEFVKDSYRTLVDRIFEINPDVHLYVISLNEVTSLRGLGLEEGEEGYENSVHSFNKFILEEIVTEYEGKYIQSISLNQDGYKMDGNDVPSDESHPNDKGNKKIGTQIYMGIKDDVLALNAQGSDVVYNPIRVTGISIDKTSANLQVGENLTITSTITPSTAEVITTVFSSSNESVATVDQYGRITAVGAGAATIYATALDSMRPGDTEIKAACNVTVSSDTYEKVDADYPRVFSDRLNDKTKWTGSTTYVSEDGAAYKHSGVSTSSITSTQTVSLDYKFSMAFDLAVIGAETKEVNDTNRSSYYTALTIGKYQLRVGINGRVVAFYYDGVKKGEKVFGTPVSRQNKDRYTLVKDGATVYVYRNNEVLFTAAVDENETVEANVVLSCNGTNTQNVRDIEVKSTYGLKKLSPTIIYASTNTTNGNTRCPASNMIDNDIKTRYTVYAWKNATPVAWDSTHNYVILDLGAEYDVSNLDIYWGAQGGAWGNSMPDAYSVSYSSDNVTYTPALSYQGLINIVTGAATDTYSDSNTSLTAKYQSGKTGNDRIVFSYGNVKEAELGWTGVRYVKIQMSKIVYNPSIAEIEVFTTGYAEGEEPDGTTTYYTVKYVDKNGKDIHDSKRVNGATIGAQVTETAVEVDGYTPDTASQTITLQSSGNVITFTYSREYTGVPEAIVPAGVTTDMTAAYGEIADIIDGISKCAGTPHWNYFKSNIPAGDGTTVLGNVVFDFGENNYYNLTEIWFNMGGCYMKYGKLYGSNLTNDPTSSAWTELQEFNNLTFTAVDANDGNKGQELTQAVVHNGFYRYFKLEIKGLSKSTGLVWLESTFMGCEGNATTDEDKQLVGYTVNYVDEEGNPVATAKTQTGYVGDSITETAVEVEGYTADAPTSKTITLVDGTNTIIFTYTENTVSQPVSLTPSSVTTTFTAASSYQPVSGIIDGVFTTGNYTYFRGANIGTSGDGTSVLGSFVFEFENPVNLTEIYFQMGGSNHILKGAVYGSNDNSTWTPIHQLGADADLTWGSPITGAGKGNTQAISHEGYYKYIKVDATKIGGTWLVWVEATFTGTVVSEGATVVGYTVNYVDEEGNPVATAKNGTGIVGDTITETAVEVEGYTADEATKSITLVDGTNTITFTYTESTVSQPVSLTPSSVTTTFPAADSVYKPVSGIINGVFATGNYNYFQGANIGTTGDGTSVLGNFIFEFDTPVNLTEIYFQMGANNHILKGAVYGSNDNSSWTPIHQLGADADLTWTTAPNNVGKVNTQTISHGGYYKYFKVDVTKASGNWLVWVESTFMGVEKVEEIEPLGASIRLEGNGLSAGLRFAAQVNKALAGIEGTYVYSQNADVKFGMYLLPKEMLGEHLTLTAYLANGVQDALDVPAKNILAQDDDIIQYTAVLIDIPTSAYSQEIIAVPYMVKNGEYTYFKEMTRSYAGVAQAARETTYSDSAIAAVTDETLKAEMQAVADELDKIIEAATEESGLRTLPFSKGINVNKMETFLSENTYGAFEEGIEELTDETTYTNIKSQGFDHVRLPINFYTIYYEATSYDYTTEQLMQYVDTAIDLAIAQDLYVILDFHGWFYIGEEENDYDEFLYCWTQVAERYKDYSDMLVFELLNEPWYTNGNPQQYLSDSRLNQMQVEAINIIRDTGSNNAERLIICCTADGNKAWRLSALSAELKACENIAVAIHEYEPKSFTHQNFSWDAYSGTTTTLEAAGGLGSVNYDFSLIKSFMEETGIPVVLGEFGLNLDKASDEDVDTYIRHITTFCATNNIPWTYWQYSGGYSSEGSMSLYRKTSYFGSQAWDTDALDALFLR